MTASERSERIADPVQVFADLGWRVGARNHEAGRLTDLPERDLELISPSRVGDFSLLLSNNASTGGTCFGDSGGPNWLSSTFGALLR